MICKQSFIYLIFIAKIQIFDYNIRQNNQFIFHHIVDFDYFFYTYYLSIIKTQIARLESDQRS